MLSPRMLSPGMLSVVMYFAVTHSPGLAPPPGSSLLVDFAPKVRSFSALFFLTAQNYVYCL